MGAILEGSVRRAGPRVRIVVHLVEPGTEKHLWGDTFDRQLTDIFEVQSEVAQQITGALSVALSPEEKKRVEKKATDERRRLQPVPPRAASTRTSGRKPTCMKGIECFQEAIAKDPGYAVAYAGLADAYELLSIGFSSKPPVEYLAQAKAMALKALEMDDTLAEAHTSLAYARWLGDLDWAGAEREFKRALELKTSYVMAHEWYAEYLAALGRHDEAVAEIKRAQQLDPLAVPVNRAVGWVLYFGRRYDEAIEELRKTLAMNPGLPGRPPGALVGAASPREQHAGGDRRYPAGVRASRTAHGEEADAGIRLSPPRATREEATGILWELESKLAGEDRLALLSALLFIALDMKDRAFQQLHRAYELREPGLLFLKVAPWLDPLRSDPRYGALVEKLGLG